MRNQFPKGLEQKLDPHVNCYVQTVADLLKLFNQSTGQLGRHANWQTIKTWQLRVGSDAPLIYSVKRWSSRSANGRTWAYMERPKWKLWILMWPRANPLQWRSIFKPFREPSTYHKCLLVFQWRRNETPERKKSKQKWIRFVTKGCLLSTYLNLQWKRKGMKTNKGVVFVRFGSLRETKITKSGQFSNPIAFHYRSLTNFHNKIGLTN